MTRAAIHIRRAGPDEAAAIADVEAHAFDTPWSADAVRALLDGAQTRGFVATRGDLALGAALVRIVAGEGELLRIATRAEARRQGIAGLLLRGVLSAVADACPHGVHLEVRASNVAARRLYAAAGFADTGVRRGYYTSPPEDAVLMHWRAR